ncbi:DNA-dependent protein kinase catalytic subunit-like [Uranotaenia lowii]|uniref:DNA-dependent protein kinase catalytic subunit-like n=1 Tax=Uranotaenia lowii TaxID=190385 RepID=UPI002478D61A|nr:DNA-dependent protein kinase catalytic subunit-like [Uranotaenia lowii]
MIFFSRTELCGHLMQLSTDPDLAVCQMFEPLTFQIIHYLTQPSKINLKGTEVFVNCLMNSISHPSDTGIRDLAARCIREFLLWTIRQTRSDQRVEGASTAAANLSMILEKLHVYCLDSNPNRRQGAALAFNNIYRILREEEAHIERVWFDLFYVFCVNFVMTEDFDRTVTNLEQLSASIDHLVRVLVVRKAIFNRSSSVRVVPRAFGGGLMKDLVRWLFGQCGSRGATYRSKCMEIFPKLATSVDGCRTAGEFVEKFLEEQAILDVCDHKDVSQGIRNASDLRFIADHKLPLISNIYLWMEYFVSSLEMFYWMMKNSLLKSPEGILGKSNIFEAIQYFISTMANASMFAIMTTIRPEVVDESHASIEFRICTDKIIKFSVLKCTIIVRIVDLLSLILEKKCHHVIQDSFWESQELCDFIVDLIYQPQSMGFDFRSCQETIVRLPKRVEELLDKIESFENVQFKERIYQRVATKLGNIMKDISDRLPVLMKGDTIGMEDSNFVGGVLVIARRYRIYASYFGPRTKDFLETVSDTVIHELFNGLKERRLEETFLARLTPSVKRFCLTVLRIALLFKATPMPLIVQLMLNDDKLGLFQQPGSRSFILHGEHFASTFEDAIFEHFAKNFADNFSLLVEKSDASNFLMILKLLCNFLDFNYQQKRSDVVVLTNITEKLLSSWPKLYSNAQQFDNKFGCTDLCLIELISNIAMASPIPLDQIGAKAAGLKPWLLELIGKQQNSIDLKAKAIFLLPTLVGGNDNESAEISATLQKLQNQHFPLRSSEFVPNSVERVSFENCIAALLDAMVVSRSPVLLRAVIDATAADGEHIAEHKIRTAFGEYMRIQNSTQQCYNLKLIFNKFCDESLEPSIRLTVLKRFLTTGLRLCSVETIITFYKINMKKVNELIRSNYGQYGSGWEAEQALVNRLGGFRLIELYVAILPRDIVLSDDCMVAETLYSEGGKVSGNRMITDLTKKAYACRSEVFLTPDTPTAELFRLYQCAAYQALIAIISNTKDDLQLYNVLLFRENKDKNEYIWRKLINCSEEHLYDDLNQELEDYPKIKDKIVSIRRLTSDSANTSSKRFKYIQMTSVFESSLSQDVTKLDLNFSIVRTTQEAAAREIEELTFQQQRRVTVSLEHSKINDHETMPMICALIQHMHENKITPTPEGDRFVLPPWVKFLSSSLQDEQQHKNVRLFLAKVVDNCRIWLKPYAKSLVPALMQVIVDECISSQLNTFVTDLLALIIEWSDVFQPSSCDEISLASRLIKFVVRNCFHLRREVFRLNLELTKNLIERWKSVVGLPVQLLYDMIGPSQDPESMQNLCGLQVNAIVMANGLVPWSETTKFDFIRAIFRCLDSERVAVYRPASELLGMCLQNIYPNGEEKDDERFQGEFIAKLTVMRKKQEKKFVDVIYGIHKNFPRIVDSFLPIIAHSIPSSSGPIKKIFLEMLLSRVEVFKEQVHRELISLDLKGMLKDRHYQLLALHLINKSLTLMSAENLEDLSDNITVMTSNEQSEVRDVVFEILMFIHDNSLTQLTEPTKLKIRKALLQGLNDSNQAIQNRMFDFWTKEPNFPQEIDTRFQSILANLYDPSQESHFIGYATHILLDPAIKNTESKRRIFQHEYEADVKLTEFTIDTRWRQRNSFASAPLFVESQQRLFAGGEGSQMERLIKATQFGSVGNVFEPTLDPMVMSQTASSFTLPSQNSLMFETMPPVLDRRSRRAAPSVGSTVSSGPKSFDSLRKRILKDKDRSARDQALKAIERHSYETVRKADSFKRKQGEVVLYRRYRIGDFPDLLINSLALLMPLQALCRRDSVLGRQVFVAVFDGILQEWEQNDQNTSELITPINQSIQQIFSETKSCDSVLFGALIELAMKRPRVFDLSPENLTTVACGANMMTMGVLYLENKLHEYDFPDESIRSSSWALTSEALHWIKLAELYHVLNEHDILADIFSDKMDSDPRLKEAIELENCGNFNRARDLYHRMILENQSRLAEQSFCYQSYFDCYAQMGMWEELIPVLERQVDGSSEDLWLDDWNMENILPKYVHANTRLNLAGDERGRGFIVMLEAWMRAPDRVEHLKSNFGEEITMLQVASGEYSRAKLYSDQVMRQFLDEWSYLDPLSDKLRIKKLLDVRKISEVNGYSHLLSERLQTRALKNLVTVWQNSNPSKADSLLIWDTLLVYRKFVLNKLDTLLEASADDGILQFDFVKELNDGIFETELRLFDASFEQNNMKFARKIIKRLDMVAEELTERGYRWRISQLKMKRIADLEGNITAINGQRGVVNFRRLKALLEEENLSDYLVVKITGLQELFLLTEKLRGAATHLNEEEMRKSLPYSDEVSLQDALGKFSLDCLQRSVDLANRGILDTSSNTMLSSVDVTLLAECHFKLAQFCYDGLEHEPLGETLNSERHLINGLLAAMQHGSKPARQLFPYLLQLPFLQDGSLQDQFIEASSLVPEWMFLRWIPQILSYVNWNEKSYLENLLLRIAKVYPLAIYYPARLALKTHQKISGILELGSTLAKINNLLTFPKLDRFSSELAQIVVPCMKVDKMIFELMNSLSDISEPLSEEEFRKMVQDSADDVFQRNSSDLGREHQKLIPFKDQWLKLLEFDFVKQKTEIYRHLEMLRQEVKKLIPKNNILDLIRYSPWLSNYHFNEREDMLEIPGQYNVDHKPNVVNHVRIVKIGGQLELYDTLRRPLRLQINGSDGKTYDFLAKYGEDLRQDQRVQQLLDTISHQMSLDQRCREHQLSVRTYEVIPIRSDFGILSWIPNTSSIKNVAVRSMIRFNPAGDVTEQIKQEYAQFLMQAAGTTDERRPSAIYGKAAVMSTPEKIKLKFNALRYKIKEDSLKRALFDMSVSPESFYNLRGNFAKSLMAMNVCCWALGIGDRHTSNLLIDRSNGKLAGVDFGIVFGAGTRDQAIPELVPFRLTPQFVNVMEPMRTSGLMHKCLVYSLTCLRDSRKLLKSCLEVFVREPTMDWLEVARYRFNQDNSKAALSWDPQTRIKIAIRKLNGANPKVLIAEELRLGQVARNAEFMNGYLKLLQVDQPPMPEGNLSVEQQSKCLLEAATSGSALGIAYSGWFPWF